MKIRYLITTLITTAILSAVAQNPKETKGSGGEIELEKKVMFPFTIFAGIGTTSYYGQLSSTQNSFKTPNYQLNIGAKYRISPRFCFGGLFRHAVLSGSDQKADIPQPDGRGRYERNLSFKTPVLNLEAFGTFDIIPFRKYYGDGSLEKGVNVGIAPYILGGIGVMYFNPTTDLNGNTETLRTKYTSLEKQQNGFYSPFTFLIMYGAGVRASVSRFIDIGFDVTFTNTFSDNLDDLASRSHYPDKSVIPLVDAQLADRYVLADRTTADLRSNTKGKILDSYFMLNVKVEYTMPWFGDKKHSKRISPEGHRNFRKNKGSKNHKFDTR